MGPFGDTNNKTPQITQSNFVRHNLYRRIRNVFPGGSRGEKKMTVVDAALAIEHDPHHQLPRLKRPIEEEDADERLERLAQANLISNVEAEKIQSILDDDLHPGSH